MAGENMRSLGKAKEALAAAYLGERGLALLESNYRCPLGEVDLVCRQGPYLVFVEVKWRRSMAAGGPLAAVGWRKQRTICRVADWYRMERGLPASQAIRFDVVGMAGEEIIWIQNAFGHQPGRR